MIIDTIITDLDDTMLDANSRLSSRTLAVAAECKRRGIRMIPVSGRTYASMRGFMDQLQTGVHYIGGNGTEILTHDHQILQQLTLDVQVAKEICTFLLDQGFFVQTYLGTKVYYEEGCQMERLYKRSAGLEGVAVENLTAFMDFPTTKVLGVNEPARVQEVLPLAQAYFAGRVTFTVSKAHYLEAEPPNASKGNAVRRLAEIRGDIVPERTLAFGDSLNDISLLAYTPNSVAVGNARDELKRVAKYICRPNTEDGLARFVEEHVLNV